MSSDQVATPTNVAEPMNDSTASNDRPANESGNEQTAKPGNDVTGALPSPKTIADEDKIAEAEPAVQGESTGAPVDDDADQTSSNKKAAKRKSSTGVPEHKSKKNNRRKSEIKTHLDVQPGDMFFALMKGHPPWPAIISDEDMLPEQLHLSRPVSAARTDGTYRNDFADGGENVKTRKYPVMFLHTNEFAWIINTDLRDLTIDEVTEEMAQKKPPKLQAAYEVAREEHDLNHFKTLIRDHEQLSHEQEMVAQEDATNKKSKKDKTAKRKSKTGIVDDEDEMMDDAEGTSEKTSKPSKKRKKDAGHESNDDENPPKTPKAIKLTKAKAANGDSAAKSAKSAKSVKSTAKPTKKAANSAKENDKPMTAKEIFESRVLEIKYFRHKLQKGFVSRDEAPKDSEMEQMDEHFKKLEARADIDNEIILETKIHKVLKLIVKLSTIPREEQFNFRGRSMKLLEAWDKAGGLTTNDDKKKTEDGEAKSENKEVVPLAEKAADEDDEAKVEKTMEEPIAETESKADNADVSMTDAPAKENGVDVVRTEKAEEVSAPTKAEEEVKAE